MIKVAHFAGADENGQYVFPLLSAGDAAFEKVASPTLLPEVARYISVLRPSQNSQYVLVNAMGAGEWWGSNVNGDRFAEAALIHAPDDWTGNPLLDRIKAKDWPYGFPTFYNAQPFAHHRNKDASRGFGAVELAAWNPKMKRVELVCRLDKDKCAEFGGQGVWDKLHAGQYVDVSMGTKVPFDTSSITLDWKTYRKAQATFDPKKHKSPGDAVLEYHKELKKENGYGIRGVSITRNDYDEFTKDNLNKILPDGRKVWVDNDYPRFFDISFVFVGAERTAKTMMKIAANGRVLYSLPSAQLAEKLGYDEDDAILSSAFSDSSREMKVASVEDEVLKLAFFGKLAKNKDAEIVKNVLPSQFAGKAVPALTRSESDLPRDVLDMLGASPLEEALSTTAGLGMVLRPREFQRIVLIQMGKRDHADELDQEKLIFPKTPETLETPMGPEFFSTVLARILLPMFMARSGLGPAVEKRVLLAPETTKEKRGESSSLSSNLLRKIGAAYNGYRNSTMELVAHAQEKIASVVLPPESGLSKLATMPADGLFTPLAFRYLTEAFLDEVGVCGFVSEPVKTAESVANVERVLPLRNTSAQKQSLRRV